MARRPMMIAVGGDSATGKTTLCDGLRRILGEPRVTTIRLDDYHAFTRAQRAAAGITALDPRATNFAKMEHDLCSLRAAHTIRKPVYDHADGTFGAPELIEPREIVLVHGLFPLYTPALRALFDLAVWLDPEPELKLTWKIRRDVGRRGYSETAVREEIARRRLDLVAHIEPQARHADLTIRFFRPHDWEAHHDESRLDVRISESSCAIEIYGHAYDALAAAQSIVARHVFDQPSRKTRLPRISAAQIVESASWVTRPPAATRRLA